MSKLKLNLGPQHPSTHGVLRLILELDGEKIISCEPDVGYLHRGMEKMAEKLTYIQYLPLVDRIDYLAGFFYSELLCRTVEKALEIELSPRVKAIRILLLELNRIASHLLWIGAFLMDLGAVSPFFYAFREREIILQYFEKISGQRMMNNYFVFGGVRRDIESLEDVENFLKILPDKVNDYEKLITENPIFLQRTKGKGVLDKKTAFNFAITGVNLRASGVSLDFRKGDYLYKDFEFTPVVLEEGDSWARYKARIMEIREYAKECGIEIYDKPSTPCLATRFPYNTKLTKQNLQMAEQGEVILKKYGYKNCRFRIHGNIARIEIPPEQFDSFIKEKTGLIKDIKALNIKYVTLDLEGIRSGSMDI